MRRGRRGATILVLAWNNHHTDSRDKARHLYRYVVFALDAQAWVRAGTGRAPNADEAVAGGGCLWYGFLPRYDAFADQTVDGIQISRRGPAEEDVSIEVTTRAGHVFTLGLRGEIQKVALTPGLEAELRGRGLDVEALLARLRSEVKVVRGMKG